MMSAHIRDALLLANLIPSSSIPSNKKLLDMACGTGALTFEANRLGIPDVTSTDFAQGMLDKLIEKAAQASPPIHVQTVLDNGQTLSKFEDASFDAVCSSFGIFLFKDRIAGFKSAARVLKPSGTFIITSWVPQKGLIVGKRKII
jgi:ubiquinone/menaquinone biosynthesis C-methylase UbiE